MFVSRIIIVMATLFISLSAVAEYRLAVFSEDVTAPIGHACMAGGILPAQKVIDPLWCHGVVLLGGDKPVVMAAIDWCEIRNDAYDFWRARLAEAAGTTPDHVLFTSVHQHDTPVADFTAQQMLDEQGLQKALCDTVFVQDAARRVAGALRASLSAAQPVTHCGAGKAEVKDVASNRRVQHQDGSVTFPRMSATADAAVREEPVGTHDPLLKTLSFWNGDQALAALHFYAVHPMSFYGKGGASSDFVGWARQLRLAADPKVHQVYFSGCSGDVVAGKWNDGNPSNRLTLAQKIYDAMVEAWEKTEKFPLDGFSLRVARMQLSPKSSAGYTEEDMKKILADAQQKTFQRILAAMGLSWRKRAAAGQPIEVAALDFGKAQLLIMPAESFVGYQLRAQEMRPDQLVCVAGYGECAPGYIPTQIATDEGFNNAHDWCWVDPGADPAMQQAMAEALSAAH